MTSYKLVALTLVLMISLVLFLPCVASAQNILMDALKVFGIAYVVRQFGGEINNFINTLLQQSGVEWEGATKVVPIISAGAGLYVGAAQVHGPPAQVNQTRAVGQIEANIGNLGGRMLIPVNTTNPTRDMERIRGVGVGAEIEFSI